MAEKVLAVSGWRLGNKKEMGAEAGGQETMGRGLRVFHPPRVKSG